MIRSITIAEGLARRQDNFLLLRIIAAIMVIYGHSFHIAPNGAAKEIFIETGWGIYSGDIAVNIFFIVSGFMVAGSYIRQADLFEFMKARIVRIVPALLVCVLLVAYVVGPLVSVLSSGDYFKNADVFRYVLRNMSFSSDMQFTLPGVFGNHLAKDVVNGSLWTLPAEFRMYVFVAILGAIGLLSHRITLLVILALLFCVGLVAPYNLPLHPEWLRLAGCFSIGILAYAFKDLITISHEGFIAVVFGVYLCRGLDIHLYVLVIALAYFCFWFAYMVRLPNLDRFGDPSYAIYLWGWPIQQLLASALPGTHAIANFLLSSAGAIAIGYVSWYLVEKPCLKLKHVWSKKSPAAQ